MIKQFLAVVASVTLSVLVLSFWYTALQQPPVKACSCQGTNSPPPLVPSPTCRKVEPEGEICCEGLPKHDYEMTDAEKVQYKVHIYRKTEPAALPIEKK